MSTITAQDVFDREKKALGKCAYMFLHDVTCIEQLVALRKEAESWERVADRVRAGEDPIIAVMSR